MVKPRQTITAYHDPNPVYYTLSEAELDQLKEKSRIPEKENTFLLIGLLIPAVINIIGQVKSSTFCVDWLFATNLMLAIVTAIISLFQIKEWIAKRQGYKILIESFKERPQVELQLSGDASKYSATTPKETQ